MTPLTQQQKLSIKAAQTDLIRSPEYSRVQQQDIAWIAQSKITSLAKLDPKVCDAFVAKAVQYIALNYGARQQVSTDTLTECVLLAQSEFGAFHPMEILQAYRLWAAGRFESLEMYGGQFNARQFGCVLTDYRSYRYDMQMALARATSQAKAEEERAQKKEQGAMRWAKRIENFPNDLQAAIDDGLYPEPRKIPEYWYKLAEAHEMISFEPGEKLQYWKIAESQVSAERARLLEETKTGLARKNLRMYYESEESISGIIVRAKQLIMWEKLLLRKIGEFPTEK